MRPSRFPEARMRLRRLSTSGMTSRALLPIAPFESANQWRDDAREIGRIPTVFVTGPPAPDADAGISGLAQRSQALPRHERRGDFGDHDRSVEHCRRG